MSTSTLIGESAAYSDAHVAKTQRRPGEPSSASSELISPAELLKVDKETVARIASIDAKQLAWAGANLKAREIKQLEEQFCDAAGKLIRQALLLRIIIGAFVHVLHEVHAGKGGGGFKGALELANLERRDAYRFRDLFLLFGPHASADSAHTKWIPNISLEGAQLLACSSTPLHLQEHFINEAKNGNQVTHKAVKEAIDAANGEVAPDQLPNDTTEDVVDTAQRLEQSYSQDGIHIRTTLPTDIDEELVSLAFQTAQHDCHEKLKQSRNAVLQQEAEV